MPPGELSGPVLDVATGQTDWLTRALDRRSESVDLVVDGVRVSCGIWQPQELTDAPTVLLVHGAAANRHWWDAVAPLLARRRRVVAIDLSGHGDSGRRPEYDLACWASEVMAVATAFGGERPWLVGHSMGGFVVLEAEHERAEDIRGLVTLDSPIRRLSPEQLARRTAVAHRTPRRFADRADALASFRTIPEAVGVPAALHAHVAEHSFVEDGAAWVHHSDPAIYRRRQPTPEFLRPVRVPLVWIRAEHGAVDDHTVEAFGSRTGPHARMVDAPVVGHHLVLEAPLATACLIESALAN